MKKAIKLLCIVVAVILFSGCSVKKSGLDLTAFCERARLGGYEITENGFIKEDNTYKKFFSLSGGDILIRLTTDEKERLERLDIAVSPEIATDGAVIDFCEVCIKSFLNDDDVYSSLNFKDNLESAKVNAPETQKTDAGSAGLTIDCTDVGTVMTVSFQNNKL